MVDGDRSDPVPAKALVELREADLVLIIRLLAMYSGTLTLLRVDGVAEGARDRRVAAEAEALYKRLHLAHEDLRAGGRPPIGKR